MQNADLSNGKIPLNKRKLSGVKSRQLQPLPSDNTKKSQATSNS